MLLDPYGGPHAQRVVQARGGVPHLAVVRRPGLRGRRRSTAAARPGAGSAWERGIHRDLAGPVLEDQIDGLLALAAEDPRLDLTRVAIRGWSFGGYLAALAVLRRPDVFHAAIAGAPVTDWRLYDTFYTERYLGHPDADADVYERELAAPRRRQARAPAAAHPRPGRRQRRQRPHPPALRPRSWPPAARTRCCPLTGVTHMANQEDVAENLLLLQLAFLREALSCPATSVEPSPQGRAGERRQAPGALAEAGAQRRPERATQRCPAGAGHLAWARKDLNLRRQCRLVYSQFPLATRARTQGLRR